MENRLNDPSLGVTAPGVRRPARRMSRTRADQVFAIAWKNRVLSSSAVMTHSQQTHPWYLTVARINLSYWLPNALEVVRFRSKSCAKS